MIFHPSNLPSSSSNFAHSLVAISVPNSFAEAFADPRCRAAMDEEMEAMRSNSTWVLTALPASKKVVGWRWVYAMKYKSDGSVVRFKARLVAKGYTQIEGVNFQETFSPIDKLNFVFIYCYKFGLAIILVRR